MRFTVRPISDRTAFAGQHKSSQFSVTYSQVLELLDRELDFLDASDIVIEVDVAESGIRLDGQVRADAKAASPAVRLAFDSNVGPLTYATDAFVRGASWVWVGNHPDRRRRDTMAQDWQHNLYAIAKALEALRLVDRYGVTKRGEQYTGFKALPAGRAMPASHMTSDEAWSILGSFGERPIEEQRENPDGLPAAYKKARAFAHPDRHDGDRALWDQVEQAGQVLGAGRS